MKQTSKTTLDRIFSEFIRRRDADEYGYIRCISCDKIVKWKESDAGHFVNRGINSLRYDEKNVNAQCRHCNRFREGNAIGYHRGLILKYGDDVIEYLEIKKGNYCKLGKFEINALAAEYRKKLNELKNKAI